MPPIDILAVVEKGGPWGLLALAIAAAIYAFKGWQTCSESRLADRDASQTIIVKMATDMAAMNAASAAVNADRAQAVQSAAAASMAMASALKQLAEKQDMLADRFFDKLEGLRQERRP